VAIVKRFLGENQKEVFNKIKVELGDEAIIINTRKIRRKGITNFFKKPLIEATAVIDELPAGRSLNANTLPDEDNSKFIDLVNSTIKSDKMEKLENQLIQVNDAINMVYQEVNLIKKKEMVTLSPMLNKIVDKLTRFGIIEENAIKIIDEAKKIHEITDTNFTEAVRGILANYLGEPSIIELEKNERKIVTFIGPTGVGKTTTLAKIAAVFSLKYDAKVGLITEDTYRIGAVEQLKIYADILGIPLEVVYEPEEIVETLEKMDDFDLILVDTAGKNPSDNSYHKNLEKLISESGAQEVHLVISSTTDYSTALKILDSYSFIKDYKILFTKLDECDKLGNILNLKMATKMPLSYFTYGQNVADDLMPANHSYILKKLLPSGGEF
jgi:flagellar biosynthesis protein FlhF